MELVAEHQRLLGLPKGSVGDRERFVAGVEGTPDGALALDEVQEEFLDRPRGFVRREVGGEQRREFDVRETARDVVRGPVEDREVEAVPPGRRPVGEPDEQVALTRRELDVDPLAVAVERRLGGRANVVSRRLPEIAVEKTVHRRDRGTLVGSHGFSVPTPVAPVRSPRPVVHDPAIFRRA